MIKINNIFFFYLTGYLRREPTFSSWGATGFCGRVMTSSLTSWPRLGGRARRPSWKYDKLEPMVAVTLQFNVQQARGSKSSREEAGEREWEWLTIAAEARFNFLTRDRRTAVGPKRPCSAVKYDHLISTCYRSKNACLNIVWWEYTVGPHSLTYLQTQNRTV